MKLFNKIQAFALGVLMAGTAIAAPDRLNDDAKLKNLEKQCSDCVLVAKDVRDLRAQNCHLNDKSNAKMISIMKNDAMFSFMLAVYTGAGTEAYKTVKSFAATQVDCENSLNWIKLIQQAIKEGKAK